MKNSTFPNCIVWKQRGNFAILALSCESILFEVFAPSKYIRSSWWLDFNVTLGVDHNRVSCPSSGSLLQDSRDRMFAGRQDSGSPCVGRGGGKWGRWGAVGLGGSGAAAQTATGQGTPPRWDDSKWLNWWAPESALNMQGRLSLLRPPSALNRCVNYSSDDWPCVSLRLVEPFCSSSLWSNDSTRSPFDYISIISTTKKRVTVAA